MEIKDIKSQVESMQNSMVIPTASHEAKNAAMTKLGAFADKVTPDQMEAAVTHVRTAKQIGKDVEAVRVELKAPFLAISAHIDTMAKEFITNLTLEAKRVEGLIGACQAREDERLQREERERQVKIREAQEKEAAAVRAAEEAARQAEIASAAALAATVTVSPADTDKPAETVSEPELDEQAAVAAHLNAVAQEALAEATVKADEVMVLSKPVASKPKGLASGKVWKYEIINDKLVYAKHPSFFSLIENKAVIKGTIDEDFSCEGMRTWQENKANVR